MLLKVIDHTGTEHTVDSGPHVTLMEVLRELEYGVAALCGGMCSCATCHVYVDEQWITRLPAKRSDEEELLNELSSSKPTSRLSCQVTLKPEYAGLRVQLAPDE